MQVNPIRSTHKYTTRTDTYTLNILVEPSTTRTIHLETVNVRQSPRQHSAAQLFPPLYTTGDKANGETGVCVYVCVCVQAIQKTFLMVQANTQTHRGTDLIFIHLHLPFPKRCVTVTEQLKQRPSQCSFSICHNVKVLQRLQTQRRNVNQ